MLQPQKEIKTKIVVIQEPKIKSFSTKIDKECAKFVRAKINHPNNKEEIAKLGEIYCSNVPAHASKSIKNDVKWLRNLQKEIENPN